jgi:hypothetical protein
MEGLEGGGVSTPFHSNLTQKKNPMGIGSRRKKERSNLSLSDPVERNKYYGENKEKEKWRESTNELYM